MVDVLILYERKNREFENCVILSEALSARGISCKISHFLDADNFDFLGKSRIKVLVVPHLYNNSSIYRNIVRFGIADFIINMQYEQVLSQKWEKLGHHNPKGDATHAVHVCWGPATKNRLINAGIPEKNCLTLGAIQMDFLRPEFRDEFAVTKLALSKIFGLDSKKSWTIFLSSFTYADISDQRLKINESVAGIGLSDFVPIYTNSRRAILDWFSQVLAMDSERIFIYRPHPDELNLDAVIELEKRFPNFKIINSGSAKCWIEASDKIYTWYSTTVVEAQILGKPCAILRPHILPDDFDSVLLKKGVFITNFSDFEKLHFSDSSGENSSIDIEYISQYYQIFQKPSHVLLCDYVMTVITQAPSFVFSVPMYARVSNYFKMSVIWLIHQVYKLNCISLSGKSLGNNNGFLIGWLLEMRNQFVTQDEATSLFLEVRRKISKISKKKPNVHSA